MAYGDHEVFGEISQGEWGQNEFGPGELQGEGEEEWGQGEHGEGELGDVREMELAAEFLEISNEEELDRFLGSIVSTIGKAAKGFIRSPVGKLVGGALRTAAKKALPIAGKAIGSYFGGSTGGNIGSQLASQAGSLFGLELEGMSGEDQEFEVARRFVRFATTATRQAARAASGLPPRQGLNAARGALVNAARRHAPGLLGGGRGGRPGRQGGRGRHGAGQGFGGAGGGGMSGQAGTESAGSVSGVGGGGGACVCPDCGHSTGTQNAGPGAGGSGFPYDAVGAQDAGGSTGTPGMQGRWVRKGRQIMLLGL